MRHGDHQHVLLKVLGRSEPGSGIPAPPSNKQPSSQAAKHHGRSAGPPCFALQEAVAARLVLATYLSSYSRYGTVLCAREWPSVLPNTHHQHLGSGSVGPTLHT